MVPLMAYFALNNKTFNLNITESSLLYKFTLEKLHIIEATGFDQKEFQYINGTDKIHAKVGGVNVSAILDADFEALHFIPFRASAVNITNLTLDFVIETNSSDQVHWKLVETSKITLGSVNIKMSNKFLDGLVRLCRSLLNSIIKNHLLPMLEKKIDGEI